MGSEQELPTFQPSEGRDSLEVGLKKREGFVWNVKIYREAGETGTTMLERLAALTNKLGEMYP